MRETNKSILFVVTASISLRFIHGQVKKLSDRGWRTGVVSGSTNSSDLEQFASEQAASAFPVQMSREIDLRTDVDSLGNLYKVMKRFRPTVLNVGTPKAGLLGGLAGVAANIPVRVYTLHGLRMETATGLKRRVLNLTERIAMACAHRIVCVSPSVQERVIELGLAPQHKTLVLGKGSPNGVRIPESRPTQEQVVALQTSLKIPTDAPVIGFVGRFTRDKGMAELMTAFNDVRHELPNAHLLLIGDYEQGDPVSSEVRQMIDMGTGVVQAGYVSDAMPYYSLMQVLALPTYREGFPTVALEAAASGVPVVTTDATGARDAVRDGFNGWRVPVGNSEALAVALLQALQDPLEAERRGRAGQTWVKEHFTPEAVQERWISLYEELLEWRRLAALNPLKRTFDIAASATGLILLSVPLALLALMVRSKLGQPAIFQQIRPGLNGQPFTMYKFRTMTDERGPDGEYLPDEQRLTSFGKLLRATSLDELPELWNVLKGDMSLVGPRPLLMEYLPRYNERQRRRHEVRPGVTGWAQVNGRNALSWEEKFEHDVWYVDHHSLALDVRILLMTIRKVFKREGISAQGQATMSKFQGSGLGSG